LKKKFWNTFAKQKNLAKNLINAVADNIAKIIEREEAEADIRKHQDHIEALIKKTATKIFLEKTITNE
jgi:ATP-dependent Lon protease